MKPYPFIPSFSPIGGEGSRLVRRTPGEGGRAVEGDSDRFMISAAFRSVGAGPNRLTIPRMDGSFSLNRIPGD